jgi:hypothetical protein
VGNPAEPRTNVAHVALTMTSPLHPLWWISRIMYLRGYKYKPLYAIIEPIQIRATESLQCLQSTLPYEICTECYYASNTARSSTRTRTEQHSGMASAACVESTTLQW